MKIRIKDLSTRFKILLLSGTFILTGMGAHGISKLKNNSNASNKDNATEIESTIDENEITEVTTTEVVASDNQIYYDEITTLESDIVEFCEDSLPNGFIEVNESNNDEMSELFINSYIQMNRDVLEPKTLAVLDQDLELIPSEISRDFMEFSTSVARYYQIATPETELQFDKLIKDEDDLEFISNLSSTIAEMNVCTDDQSRQEKINEIIEIKKSLLTDSNIATKYNSETLYLATKMIIYADATAKAYGQEIITEEESEMQLYSAFYNVYCDIAVSSGYIEDTEVIDREISSQSAFESKYLSTSADVLDSMIEKVADYNEKFDKNYAYGEVADRISEKIVGLYVKPEQTHIEKENEIREQTSDAIDEQTIGTTTTTVVTPEEVPEEHKVPTTEEVKEEETGNVITEGYAEGLAAGRTDGSNAAWNQQTSTGVIPNEISASGAPTPGGNKSSEYINGYKEGYAEGWNVYVASAKAAQSAPTTEYQPVENGKEEIISETTPETVPYEDETEFIPVENGEEVEFIPVEDGEEVEVIISQLNDIKNYVLSIYGETYELALEDEGVKKM